MKDLQRLPSLSNASGKVASVRIVYEGQRGERSWHEQLHPGLLFAPVSPTPQATSQLLLSAFEKAELQSKEVNAISHALMIRFDTESCRRMGLFTGDLEGRTWRSVKNRCLEITTNAIKSELSFVKVPHHGAYNPHMEQSLQELIGEDSDFVASISCPPGDPSHPAKRTLEFFKNKYRKCCITCTNISTLCHAEGFPSIPRELFEQSPGEAEFLQIASSDRFDSIQPPTPGACAGNHTITITGNNCTLTRSTGLPCSFNPSGCANEHQ